jgi:hypothetical protein
MMKSLFLASLPKPPTAIESSAAGVDASNVSKDSDEESPAPSARESRHLEKPEVSDEIDEEFELY